MGLALAGPAAVYVTEMSAGQIARVDATSGAVTVITKDLARPQAIAAANDGSLVVVEAGARRLTRVDPGSGAKSVIARELPIALATANALIGVASGAGGAIYVTSDVDNSIWKFTPKE